MASINQLRDKSLILARFNGHSIRELGLHDITVRRWCKQTGIVASATLSKEALISGGWLKEGQHLDLVGSFTAEMPEADNNTLAIADKICA